MADIFDINTDQAAGELLVPDKRDASILYAMKAFLSAVGWMRDLFFGSYRKGSSAPGWSIGSYNKFQQVIYKKVVFESLINSNTDTPNINQDTTSWRRIQDYFVGSDERVLYNGNKLVFEYALNHWFNTNFRQPPNTSDIYLTTSPPGIKGFLVGGSKPSAVFLDHSMEFVGNAYFPPITITLTINIPVAVYNALSSDATERMNIVRSFANKYVAFGLFYNINPY